MNRSGILQFIQSHMGLVSKGEKRTMRHYLIPKAVCFYCKMFIVAGLLC